MGNNSWTHPPFFSRHLVPPNVGNIIFVCYFLNIGSESNRNPNLRTSPKNQFRDYHAWNRIEKLMPQHYTNFQKLLKFYGKRPTCFQTLTFCRNLSFQKSWICPWFFQGLSMDFPPHGFSGRPRGRPTKIFPRQGRISRLPEGSLVLQVFDSNTCFCLRCGGKDSL